MDFRVYARVKRERPPIPNTGQTYGMPLCGLFPKVSRWWRIRQVPIKLYPTRSILFPLWNWESFHPLILLFFAKSSMEHRWRVKKRGFFLPLCCHSLVHQLIFPFWHHWCPISNTIFSTSSIIDPLTLWICRRTFNCEIDSFPIILFRTMLVSSSVAV